MEDEKPSYEIVQNIEGDYKPTFHDFYDLMKFRVSRILLVSSLYDAFTLEEEGLVFEQISGEYQDLSLSSPPQVVRVSSGESALTELRDGFYDMIITMARISDMDPQEFGIRAKKIKPEIPVILLLTDTGDIPQYSKRGRGGGLDKVFFWNGDSALFLAITKYVEDLKNISHDIETGQVRVILIVEDSPRYYSVFLPIIYTEIMHQTRSLITEGINEHEKLLRRRARPKILLAEDYEEATSLYDKYRDYILSVITDVTYDKGGKEMEGAGFDLMDSLDDSIPVLVQSSYPKHRVEAHKRDARFIDKNSDSLLQELRDFFKENLGFGDFVFTDPNGKEIDRASDIKDFIEKISEIPLESLTYHGRANDFSNWLMARGEIALAKRLRPKRVSDFQSGEEMRQYLLDSVREARRVKQLGVITDFPQQSFEFRGTVTRLGGGSLGGKGRGIAFLSALLNRTDAYRAVPNCDVSIPDTLIIGTDEFDRFLEHNNLLDFVKGELTDEEILRRFSMSQLPGELRSQLKIYLDNVRWPIAVRSSSLLEDSQNQPFAGIYSTYLLPNNCGDSSERLDQLCQAIKLVYASAFMKAAKAYIQTTVHLQEEEKMAIVVQKLIGKEYGNRFYPVISGVVQSCNFYPMKPLKRNEGIANVALGLGRVVVEGEKVLAFSPQHPDAIPGFSNPAEVLENSQKKFYVLDMSRTCFDLIDGEETTLGKLDVSEAMEDGTLGHIASTYDRDDNRLRDGLFENGTPLITFSGVLKYGTMPLVKVLKQLIELGRKGLGRNVEIEFAVNVDENDHMEFYLLQIRPLVAMKEHSHVLITQGEKRSSLVYTEKALGNGILEGISEIVFVKHDTFDRTSTVSIAEEVGKANDKLSGKHYLLVGPGRWGTRDRFLGIPVKWDHISWARAIVETSLEDLDVDPSHGTHFFHNMTSLGIPYLTCSRRDKKHHIDLEWLQSVEGEEELEYVKIIHLPEPLVIKVDGRSGKGIVSMEENRSEREV